MSKIKIVIALVVLLFTQNLVFARTKENSDCKLAYINLDWWKNFNDPMLENYLLKAYQNNHDLKIATIKIKEGQQVVKQSLGQEMPQISFDGSLNRTLRSSNIYYGDVLIPEYSQNQFLLPLTMSYEIDIWGKNRLKTKSAKKQLDILKQSERATYISLTSTLSADYYTLVKVDKMLYYQNKILAIQKNITNLMEEKYKSGLTSLPDVLFERKKMATADNEKNILEKDRDVLTSQIKTMLDLPEDEDLKRISFDNITLINLPEQIDSDIIQNRPDFIISEEQLKKIGMDVKVAKKELLPSFILTGDIGFNSYEGGKIFSYESLFSSIGIMPYWNVFTGGQKIAYLRFKKYEYEEATEKYKKTVLTSMHEVNDSLIIAKTAKKNYKDSMERLNLENQNYQLISQKYNIGGTSNLQRLKAQEVLWLLEENEVSNKINCLISAIGLYKAVGGKNIANLKNESL